MSRLGAFFHLIQRLLPRWVAEAPAGYQRCAMICKSRYCGLSEYEQCSKRIAYQQLERDN